MPRARRSFSCVYGAQTIQTGGLQTNFILISGRGEGKEWINGGSGRIAGVEEQNRASARDCATPTPCPGIVARDTSMQRYLLTLPRNCPRFRDLHGIRSNFTAKLLLWRGERREAGGLEGGRERSGEKAQPLCPLRVPEV